MEQISSANCLGKKILILGEVNTGKTTLCRSILEDLCALGLGPQIAIVDLAPHIPDNLATRHALAGVGGHLVPPADGGSLYLAGDLVAPRLTSSSEAEAIQKAGRNRAVIEDLLKRAAAEHREILFMNDLTMYLQDGTADALIAHFELAATVVANGYWGERLGGGQLTRRERAQTRKLREWFESIGAVVTLER